MVIFQSLQPISTTNPLDASLIVVGGNRSGGVGARFYDGSLNLILSQSTSASVSDVKIVSSNKYIKEGRLIYVYDANNSLSIIDFLSVFTSVISFDVDNDFNIYVLGVVSAGVYRIVKYNNNIIWTSANINTSVSPTNIFVDNNGNTYVSTLNNTGSVTDELFKYNPNGIYEWSRDHGNFVNDVVTDNIGNVYIVGNSVSGVVIRKYDTNGNLLLNISRITTDHFYNCITIGNDGRIYAGGGKDNPALNWGRIYVYNTSGTLLTEKNVPNAVLSIKVDINYNVYVTTDRIFENLTLYKYNSAFTLLNSADHGAVLRDVDINKKV